ncbi:type IV secretion system protein [Nitrosomonas sp. HPC101]|uniref:type IV secretion system protein n=1 Tax=Nitrosomonas sp. HPC101 TaxID=1658667 RepID=UPI001F04BC4B|nr:type IV secretion system protein [Nitrosomonas sp. HPC101]
MGIIERQATQILDLTKSWSDVPNMIITWVTPALVLGLTISIMWQGYKIVRGIGGQNHLLDVFFNSLRAFLIFSLCLAAGTYASNIMAMAYELRDGLTVLFSGTEANIYAQLDKVLFNASKAYKNILDYGLDHLVIRLGGSDFTGLPAIIGGAFTVGFIVLYTIVAAINMIIIDFSLAIMFALGPLFIACLSFQGTAQFFNTWLSSILKYIFTAVAITAIVGLGMQVVSNYADALLTTPAETIDYIGTTLAAVVSSTILIILTMKGAAIGADLSGGIALQIASLAQAARWSINPAGAALSTVGKVAGAGAGNLAGRAGAAAARTGVGQAMDSSPAMKYAMAGINTMLQIGGGARAAMSHRSVVSATRAGFQSGSSVGRGTGSITK